VRVIVLALFPGTGFTLLILIPLAGPSWPTVVGVVLLLSVAMFAFLVWRYGADVLTETSQEIIDEAEAIGNPVPGEIPAGEYSSAADVVRAFDSADGNRPDTPR